jgi:hypothetical protein
MAFQFYFQSGKKRKEESVGEDSHFPGENGSARVRCRNATSSSFVAKVRGELFARFNQLS